MDPASFLLDASRVEDAVGEINRRLANAKGPNPDVRYEASDLPKASSLEELLERCDHGEPLWNGTLMLLARETAKAAPTTLEVTSLDELPAFDGEFITRFHHGDLIVRGDFGVFESVWITGSVRVEGVVEASYLDAYHDLMVGGDLRCRAIQFMGLSLIAGALEVERFAFVHSQGENWVLGGVRGPCLIGEYESVAGWDLSQVPDCVDLDESKLAQVAALLGVSVEEDDEHGFEPVLRAFDAARATAPE